MRHGVYQIRNLGSGKRYIGSAAGRGGFQERWRLHCLHLNRGSHHSIKLQRAWIKYGEDTFVFEILIYCDPANCLTYEQIAMDYSKLGYNISPTAGNCLGVKRSEASKQKMRGPRPKVSGSGNPMYGKTGNKCPSYGLKRTEQTKSKMAIARSKFLNKIQEQDISKIKQLLLAGYTHKEIAQQFDVHRSTISKIHQRKTWRYV